MHLPLYDVLEEAFSKRLYRDPLPEQASSIGFVTHSVAHKLIPFLADNTIAFEVQLAKKRVPTSAVAEAVRRRCAEIEDERGYKPGRKERAEIKEEVTQAMIKTMPAALTRVECFYDPSTRILVVGTGSKAIADDVTALLVNSLEAVQTRTLNVSSPARGLTAKLSASRYVDYAFGPFTLGQAVVFARDKQRISVRNRELEATEQAIGEALDVGFLVKELALEHKGLQFRLTDAFQFKGLQLTDAAMSQDDDFESAADQWLHEATILFSELREAIAALVQLLGRDRLPEEEKAAA